MISITQASETKLFMARKTKSVRTLRSEFRLQAVRGENHVNRLKAELQTKKAVPRSRNGYVQPAQVIKSAQP